MEWFCAPKLGYVNTVLDQFFVRPENFTWQFVHTKIVKYFLFAHPRETCEPIWILTSLVPSRRRWFRMCVTCQKKLFRPFGRPVGLKIRGWGGEGWGGAGPSPGSATYNLPDIGCPCEGAAIRRNEFCARSVVYVSQVKSVCIMNAEKTNQNKALLWEEILLLKKVF